VNDPKPINDLKPIYVRQDSPIQSATAYGKPKSARLVHLDTSSALEKIYVLSPIVLTTIALSGEMPGSA
jgi:hypothetical protein